MKELVEDFRAIYRNDRGVLVTMIVLILIGVVLFALPLMSLNASTPRIWARYTDINSGYAEGSWWYLISWSILAVLLTIGHCLIGARLYSKRGKGVAILFLVISMMIVLVAISYLMKILGRG